jgi:hypothetical protein
MTDFIDPFPQLPQVIDLGGDRYFMGAQKPIELGFKDRKTYLGAFGNDTRTEYLLRKYLFLSLSDKRKLSFEDPEEKKELIDILKKYAKKLERSKEFTSSTLKNTLIQRSYTNIVKLIQQLEGPEYKGFEFPSMANVSLPCTKAKKYIREIPEEHKFQLILEIAWYLLHPEDVPKKIECDWVALIKNLDTLRLGDLMGQIHSGEKEAGINSLEKPLNYFKRVNIDGVVKARSKQNALDQAKEMALKIQDEGVNSEMKERLKTILNILEVKKYLANDLPVNKDRLKIIDVPAAEKISSSLISNPMKGGANLTLNKPLKDAMSPLFNYFKVVYDPIYSIVDGYFKKYLDDTALNKVMLPQLTTLLHICNNINPSEEARAGKNTYGVYCIKNVDPDVILFINSMLSSTAAYIEQKFSDDDAKKNLFNRQLFQLPRVRLSTLLNKFVNLQEFKDPDLIPYVQLFTVGGNMTVLKKEDFLKADRPERSDVIFNEVTKLFNPQDLYVVCTKQDNVREGIPMNVYEINFEEINVSETGLQIKTPDNYFNKNKEPEMYMETIVDLKPYVVFNDTELALSILVAFKELMPN